MVVPGRERTKRALRVIAPSLLLLLGGWGCAMIAGVEFDDARMMTEDPDGSPPTSKGDGTTPTTSSTPAKGCPPGQTACGADCVDTQTSLAHCGGCDRPCNGPNADAACTGGTCRITCRPGFADCANDPPKSCAALPKWFVDGDGDGWGSAAFVSACTQPAGHVTQTGDCLDTNAEVHPDAGSFGFGFFADGGVSFDYDCDGVETELDGGIPHFPQTGCGSGCDELGMLPAPLRAGPAVTPHCGSTTRRVCARVLSNCRMFDSQVAAVQCR